MNEERRKSARLPVEGENGIGRLVSSNRSVPVLLIDETVYGLGMVAVRPRGLEVGMKVEFHSELRQRAGQVGAIRHLSQMDEEVFRIGIEWID